MLKILEQPQIEPVSLSLLKEQLRVSHGQDDDRLGLLLVSARETLERYTNRAFIHQKVMLTFRPSLYQNQGLIMDRVPYRMTPGSVAVRFPLMPYADLEQVRVKDQKGTYHEVPLTKTDVHPSGHTLMIHVPWHPEIQVVYRAGYGDLPEDVPAPLRVAVLQLAAALYEGEGAAKSFWSDADVQSLLTPFRGRRL